MPYILTGVNCQVYYGSISSQNGHIPLFGKIYIDLLLFAKYLAICHLFEIRVCYVTRVPETWVLWKNSLQICHAIFYGTQVPGTRVPWKTQVSN